MGERFIYRIWDATDGERELLVMFNASDMGDALQKAAALLARKHNGSRIELERAGRATPTLDSSIIAKVDTPLKIDLDQTDWAKGKM